MNRRVFISSSALVALSELTFGKDIRSYLSASSLLSNTEDETFKEFVSPPDASKAGCYWWWFNGLIDKEGIDRDLTEFKDKGIMDILLVNSAGKDIPIGVKFLSDEWRELYRYALRKAKLLNIKIGVNLCSGWAMGGPWITPDIAGRWYLQSELRVAGPTLFSNKLPLPGNRTGYDHIFNAPGYKEYIDLPLEELDYRDSAVVAFKVTGNEKITDKKRQDIISAKSNRKDASNFIKARTLMDSVNAPLIQSPADSAIDVKHVVNLTDKLNNGILVWDVPEGEWIIIRTGHRMTGSKISIAQPEADGLSVGWLNSEGVVRQFEHLGKILLEDARKENYKLHFFCDDSFEDGFPNWTAQIIDKFIQYRGYDPTPYLPALSGYLIENTDVTSRFLNDYRKTVADCMADSHYKKFAELCHENGLLVQNEAAGPSRSGTMCMDGLKNLGRSDLPAGEFWLGIRHDEEDGLSEKLSYGESRLEGGQNKVCKMVASAAHIYGKHLASAEAYTSYRHWQDSPASLKQATDRAFCEGINRLMIHTSSATRPKDGKPGYEYYAGTHFNPNVTWWEYSGSFLTYIARCQHLLRKGRFVADVLFYNGDWAPNIVEPKHINPSLGAGYDYDVCNEEVLLTRLSVKNKLLTLPDGMQYRVLVLPDCDYMPQKVLHKLHELVKLGATIVGRPPIKDSGLFNYPQADSDIKYIVSTLWGAVDGNKTVLNNYGKGRVYWGKSIREILLEDGIVPDFISDLGPSVVDFIHRRDEIGDIYFIANRTNREINPMCSFRISGRKPEIWDPVKGKNVFIGNFQEIGKHTTIPFKLYPFQSFFVVFSKKRKTKVMLTSNPFKDMISVQNLSGPWNVSFDPKWGAPENIIFNELQDWSKHNIHGVRYYSGKAVYTKEIHIEDNILASSRIFINLGKVKDIAKVKLNGIALEVLWTAPWTVEITDVVKQGTNNLEISVINLWPNRLIGDSGLPEAERFTRTNIAFKKDQKLLPSGLLGPVTIDIFN